MSERKQGRNRGPEKFGHVLAQFQSAWLITPEKLAEIEAALRARVESGTGGDPPRAYDDYEDGFSPRPGGPGYKLSGTAAVIPVHGTIFPRPNIFMAYSGGCSAEQIGRAVEQAAADPKAAAIVLDIDSPGGSVYGVPEAAAKILAARKVKPVYAVANHVAASAAYWLASQANTVAVSPSGTVGSVGVIWPHVDLSRAEDLAGRKTTYVTAGQFKAEGAQEFPLDDEARAERQRIVNDIYAQFVGAVAKGRGLTPAAVERDFGQGRMRLAREAVTARMADRVATLEDVLREFAPKPVARPASRAAGAATGAGAHTGAGADADTERVRRRVAADLARAGLPTAVVARPAALAAAFTKGRVADDIVNHWADAAIRNTHARPAALAPPAGAEAALRWPLAVHEAGHVVCALALGCVVHSAFVAGEERGSAEYENPTGSASVTAATILAGGLAEALFTRGPDPFGPGGSARLDVQQLGERGEDATTVSVARLAAERLLVENAAAVERVARGLAALGYVTGPGLREIAGELKKLPGM